MNESVMRLPLPEPDDSHPLDWYPGDDEPRGLPGVLTETSYTLPEGLNIGEWLGIGETLQRMERSVQWWIGDWWRYGERKYGDMASQASKDNLRTIIGRSYATVKNYASVASRFTPDQRSHDVPFSHYQDVQALPQEQVDGLLGQASKHKWTRVDLREMVKSERELTGVEATTPPRLSDEPSVRASVGNVFLHLSALQAACDELMKDDLLTEETAERVAVHLESAGIGLVALSDRFRGAAADDAEMTPSERAEARRERSSATALRSISRFLGASLSARQADRMGPMGERVYFIRSKQSGLIKIGTSRWPRRRFQEIKLATGQDVDLLGTIPGSRDVEAELHEKFASTRVTGEWFSESDELMNYINQHAELHSADEPSPRRRTAGVGR